MVTLDVILGHLTIKCRVDTGSTFCKIFNTIFKHSILIKHNENVHISAFAINNQTIASTQRVTIHIIEQPLLKFPFHSCS